MSLRNRLTVAGSGAVFVALAIASVVIYFAVRSRLYDQVDFSLVQSAQDVSAKWSGANGPPPVHVSSGKGHGALKLPARTSTHADQPIVGSDASGYFEVIPNVASVTNGEGSASGGAAATSAQSSATLTGPTARQSSHHGRSTSKGFGPLIGVDAWVAKGFAPPYFRDIRYRGVAMRLYTTPLASARDGLVRTARPLTEANATIARVRWLLLALTLAGALAAGLLGRLAANAVLRPVRALAGAVREVSVTRDLNQRIPVSGRDELASLAADFNTMFAALDESQRAQQQLIADASHELRTPLTAHRANIELLARPDLPAEQRQRVLAAAVRTIGELSTLVGDLIRAARDGRSVDARHPLALDELVAAAVERAQHRAPELRFECRLEPCQLVGARSRLERAVDNVLDNAIKWSPSGGAVDIRLVDGILTVRDHGPGIAEADLPHVFDRFYRAAAARALPGSGLGLAIVKETLEDHGGSVTVANADGGGALLTLRFGAGEQ
jgi:two-component system sensor histidine kinase MprB